MSVGSKSSPLEPDGFFSEAPAPLAVVQRDGVIMHANAAFARTLSDEASVIGLSFASLLREEDRHWVGPALAASAPTTFEVTPIACAGALPPRRIRFTAARSDRGHVNLVGVEVQDSSSRLHERVAQLEDELREQLAVSQRQASTLQVFSQLLDTAPVIVWAVDPEGRYTMFEGKGLELVGANPGEAVGENALQPQEGNSELSRAITAALGGESTRMMTSPVTDLHFENWLMPLYRHDGTVGAMCLSIDVSERVRVELELREKLDLITQQTETIRALATPIIQVWDDILCLPMVGTVDSERTAEMMQDLLEAIARYRVRYAIVDLTGVDVVNTSTADHVIKLLRAAKMIGVAGVLCGIRPAVAQTVVALGVDLGSIPTRRTLRDALKWCLLARTSTRATRSMATRQD